MRASPLPRTADDIANDIINGCQAIEAVRAIMVSLGKPDPQQLFHLEDYALESLLGLFEAHFDRLGRELEQMHANRAA